MTKTISPKAQHEIANKLIDGKVCEMELTNTQEAYKKCVDDTHPDSSFWAKPEVEIGGGMVLSLLGFVFGFTRCFGACK